MFYSLAFSALMACAISVSTRLHLGTLDSLVCSSEERKDDVTVEEYRRKLEGNLVVRQFLLRPASDALISSLNIDKEEYRNVLIEALTINQEFVQTFLSYSEIEPAILREGLENACRELRDAKLNELYQTKFSEEMRHRLVEVFFQESFAQLLVNDSDLHSCLGLTDDDRASFLKEVFGEERSEILLAQDSSIMILVPRFKMSAPERAENECAYVLYNSLTSHQQELLDELLGEPIPSGWLALVESKREASER